MELLVIGLGSNIGDRRSHLEDAIRLLGGFFGQPAKISAFFETEPWGFESENWFLNGVVGFEVEGGKGGDGGNGGEDVRGVGEVFEIMMEVERRMGRIRNGRGYGDRIIDLDLLFFGGLVIETTELVVPHPRLHERSFVLEPLSEIYPALVHPVLQKTVLELLKDLKNQKTKKTAL